MVTLIAIWIVFWQLRYFRGKHTFLMIREGTEVSVEEVLTHVLCNLRTRIAEVN